MSIYETTGRLLWRIHVLTRHHTPHGQHSSQQRCTRTCPVVGAWAVPDFSSSKLRSCCCPLAPLPRHTFPHRAPAAAKHQQGALAYAAICSGTVRRCVWQQRRTAKVAMERRRVGGGSGDYRLQWQKQRREVVAEMGNAVPWGRCMKLSLQREDLHETE